jgi:hypothetical protein
MQVCKHIFRMPSLLELEFFLRPPFGTLDRILACSSFVWQLRYSAFNASSLTRKRICSFQCNRSLVRSLTPNNHTVPSHLRLCSLSVAFYDSQGLRWRYSNPPPHGAAPFVNLAVSKNCLPQWETKCLPLHPLLRKHDRYVFKHAFLLFQQSFSQLLL